LLAQRAVHRVAVLREAEHLHADLFEECCGALRCLQLLLLAAPLRELVGLGRER
jgi:hypothetical protein